MNTSKVRNRIISVSYIFVFALALLVMGLAINKLVKEYQYRDELIAQKEELENEKNWQDEMNSVIDDDQYLAIYEQDNLSINDEETTLFVFTK
jgi:formiminotetrahydrofolate cyclodeaminase